MSAAVSHQGGWTRCQPTVTTPSRTIHASNRVHQRRKAMISSSAKTTFKHSNQRQGSCTKRSFGRWSQAGAVRENIRSVAAASQATSIHQIDERRCQRREKKVATASTMISAMATKETSRLNRL